MARAKRGGDPVVERLDAILRVLQDLMILEGARAGIPRDGLQGIVAVDNNRISRVMKHVRRARAAIKNG